MNAREVDTELTQASHAAIRALRIHIDQKQHRDPPLVTLGADQLAPLERVHRVSAVHEAAPFGEGCDVDTHESRRTNRLVPELGAASRGTGRLHEGDVCEALP